MQFNLQKRIMNNTPSIIRRMMRAHESRAVLQSPFFRRHHYNGRMQLHAVDWHTAIDFDLGVLFHRIPKVANSSLAASISQLRHDAPLVGDQDHKRQLRHAFRRPSSLSLEEVGQAEAFFKFLLVRNPYDRVLSAYLSKVRNKQVAGGEASVRLWRGSSAFLPSSATFEQFCLFLQEGGLYTNYHWAPQSDFLVHAIEKYDYIGKLENIDDSFQIIKSRLGLHENAHHMSAEDPSHATNASIKIKEYYNENLIDMVYNIYKSDFNIFEYDKYNSICTEDQK